MSASEGDGDLEDPVVRARIVTVGPVGHWQPVPGTQLARAGDSIQFDPDGSGRLHSWSVMLGPQTESFRWQLPEPGVLALRPDPAQPGEAWQRVPFMIVRCTGHPARYTEVYWALSETAGSGFWWLPGPIVPV